MYEIDESFKFRELLQGINLTSGFLNREMPLSKMKILATDILLTSSGELAACCYTGHPLSVEFPSGPNITYQFLLRLQENKETKLQLTNQRGSGLEWGIREVDGEIFSESEYYCDDVHRRLHYGPGSPDIGGLFMRASMLGQTFNAEEFPRFFDQLRFSPSGKIFAMGGRYADLWILSRDKDYFDKKITLHPPKDDHEPRGHREKTFSYTSTNLASKDMEFIDEETILVVSCDRSDKKGHITKLSLNGKNLEQEVLHEGFDNYPYLITGSLKELYVAEKSLEREVDMMWINQKEEFTSSLTRFVPQ